MAERRVILVGKTGNGKSSTGNTLLGYDGFKVETSLNPVTEYCKYRISNQRERWPIYQVCDTPGLMDVNKGLVDRVMEIQRAVEICPKPHAFLLVLDATNRVSEDEKCTIDLLRVIFGEKVFEHCIVVFTHGGNFKSDAAFKKFWQDSDFMTAVMEKCGNRGVRIENSQNATASDGIHTLLGMIEEVSKRGQCTYNYLWLESHAEVLKQHRKNYNGPEDVISQLDAISKSLAQRLTRDKWKTGLFLSSLAVGGIAAVGGAGAVAVVAVRSAPAVVAAIGGLAGRTVGTTAGRYAISVATGLITGMKFW